MSPSERPAHEHRRRPPRPQAAAPGFTERVDDLPTAGSRSSSGCSSRVFLFLLPLLNIPFITTPDSDFGGVLFTVATYVLVALGLNIVVGYAGLLDLGYVGFYAIGAYTVGVLSAEHAKLPWLLAPSRSRSSSRWSRASSSARRRCACVATTSPS